MKRLIVAALAAAGLAGCVAVPVPGPYYGDAGYYNSPPAVAVGVYPAPVYYGYGGRYHRHYRRW